jgi:hypothetical protein
MVDSINSNSAAANRARNTGAAGSREANAPTGSAPATAEPAASVEVKLSNEIRSSENATFDEVKGAADAPRPSKTAPSRWMHAASQKILRNSSA